MNTRKFRDELEQVGRETIEAARIHLKRDEVDKAAVLLTAAATVFDACAKHSPSDDATCPPRAVLANTDRARIMDILRAHPQRAIVDVAREVYGSTKEPARAKVRSHLDQLKKRGLAHAVEPGKWEILRPVRYGRA